MMESNLKKMVLVPYNFESEKVDINNLTNPLNMALVENIQEKSSIINSHLGNQEKDENLKRNSIFFFCFNKKLI